MADSEELKEHHLNSKSVFEGKLLHVFKDEARLPNGHTAVREWIKHPGSAAVVPIFANGDTMLVKQYRYPLDKIFLEVPAGKIDEGEDHPKTVKRELKEEAGLLYEKITYLGPYYPTIGYANEVIHLYCAWEITEGEAEVDEDEFLKPLRLPFKEALQMIFDGKITDGKTMVNLMLADKWWRQNGPFEI